MSDHFLTDAEIAQLEAELREEERLRLRSYSKPKWRVLSTAIGATALVLATTGVILLLVRWL